MKRLAFLLNTSISGIKNIKKEVKIDFYGKTVNKKTDFETYKIKGIYGENGSGKTAIVTAFDIAKQLILDEDYLGDYQNRMLLNDIINKQTREFVFKCEFVSEMSTFFIF